MSNKKLNPEIESRKPLEFPATMENPPSPENRRSQKPEKLFYKRWWFGFLVVMAIGTYNQLTSSIEGFTPEEAQYAVDKLFQS